MVKLLDQIISIANNNIGKAENFDLEDFAQQLESYSDQLKGIGGFESYKDMYDKLGIEMPD